MQEEIGPQASLDEDVVLAKKGDVDDFYKDGTSSGCNCYMQILSISGHSGYWRLHDVSNPAYNPEFNVLGNGPTWYNSGSYDPLPSAFLPLAPPDAGCHHFEFTVYGGVQNSTVTLFTSVICCDGAGSCTEGNAATQTYHQFSVVVSSDIHTEDFFKKFSCTVLPAGEEDCDPRF